MKRLLIGILLLVLLTGCGGGAPERGTDETGGALPPGAGLWMELEHSVYDPSLTSFTYFIRNGAEKAVEFGEPYHIQRREGDRWTDLTMRENWGFLSIGYSLEPGSTMSLTCTLDMYEESPEQGEYRLVKTVGEETLYAEFRLGESGYTAGTPYGFEPLEDLPETYGADTAGSLDVVFTGSGVRNGEALEEFLFKVSTGADCQLRTVQDYGEGSVLTADVIFENDHFLRRERSGGIVTQRRYSYLVTDGQDLYLSNGADWESGEKYGDERIRLVPEGVTETMTAAVEAMTEVRLKGNIARYRVWSDDGVWDAALLEDAPIEFSVGFQRPGEGSWGEVFNLHDWDGTETAILELDWQADNTLLLYCETLFGGLTRYLVFEPETERLTVAKG